MSGIVKKQKSVVIQKSSVIKKVVIASSIVMLGLAGIFTGINVSNGVKYNSEFENYASQYDNVKSEYDKYYDGNGNVILTNEEKKDEPEEKSVTNDLDTTKKKSGEIAKTLNEMLSISSDDKKLKDYTDHLSKSFDSSDIYKFIMNFDDAMVLPEWQFTGVIDYSKDSLPVVFLCRDKTAGNILAIATTDYNPSKGRFGSLTLNLTSYGQSALKSD